MKTINLSSCNIIIVMLIITLIGMSTNSFSQDKIILQGKIEVVKQYEDEEIYAVLKVVSTTRDEEGNNISSIEEYPIEDNSIGKRLYQFDGKTVEATGTIFEDNYGPVWFSITSFKLIEEGDDENQNKTKY